MSTEMSLGIYAPGYDVVHSTASSHLRRLAEGMEGVGPDQEERKDGAVHRG